MEEKYDSLEELYQVYPIKTVKKFQDKAEEFGFTRSDAKHFLDTRIIKDKKIPSPQFMHIYSKVPNAFQMDTFIHDRSKGGRII